MINTKKLTATALLGCSIMSIGVPAFAADTDIPVVKNVTAITETASVIQPRAASFEVTGDYVRLRKNPNTSSATIGYLMKGDLIAVNGEAAANPVYADGHYWVPAQVTVGSLAGNSGWIAMDYLVQIG